MKFHACTTPNCENEVLYPRLGLCSACYQYIWKWKQRPISHIMHHKKKLRLYETRMEIIEPRVTTFRRKTARK